MEENKTQVKGNISKLRDTHGRFIKASGSTPAQGTAISSWFEKITIKSGFDLHIKIKPITLIAIFIALGIFSFAVGRISTPPEAPVVKYIPQTSNNPPVNQWSEASFSGILALSDEGLYSIEFYGKKIILSVPYDIELSKYVGRRILVTGLYYSERSLLAITESSAIEILPSKSNLVPTSTPADTPNVSPGNSYTNPIYQNPSM